MSIEFGRMFFLDWAMRDQIRVTPDSLIRIIDGTNTIMGYVPDRWNNSVVELHAKPEDAQR